MEIDSVLWPAPREAPRLNTGEVHVWCGAVDSEASRLESLLQLLSADEREKVGLFRFQKPREEFIVARGLLRIILGRCLDANPAELRFQVGPHGKPSLALGSGHDALCFNVAHSGGLILFAVSPHCEVGVDVERVCSNLAVEELASRFFSPRENATLLALPEKRRREGFFACWTRKEAFLKAQGDGLSQALDSFDVSLVPGEPAALLASRSAAHDIEHWSIQELPSIPGYAGAVAAEGLDWELRCWRQQ